MQFILKPFKEEITVERLANIHYFEFTPHYETSGDSHAFCELLYVDSGKIDIVSEHYTGELCERQMIVHGANQTHALQCGDGQAPSVVIIGFECKSAELEKLTYAPLSLSAELQKMLAEIIKEARTVYEPPYDVPNLKNMKKRKKFTFGADQLIKNYLQIFLIKCLRDNRFSDGQPTPKPRMAMKADGADADETRAREVKKYLDVNYAQKINVDELCFLFGTNKTTLSREFKRLCGKTVVDYVNALRIEHTKRLLRENSYTLTQIAAALNISSVHYLTALFKKYTGITPTQYVQKIKKTLNLP
ncbi:MAG: helix-turn-helix transcriptional regulator [Clostridia bacterium]|nr:helix-turn-helix transcriptional regulator [Clostridia bacterium]